MKRLFRTASYAATSFCAFAAMGGFPAQQAIGATMIPAPVLSDPLPPVPAVESTPGNGIAINAVPEVITPAVEAPAATLSELVARHGGDSVGNGNLNCLATAVYFESKGEPLTGQLAVAQVVMNRAASGRFRSTVCGVVKQPSQFSFVRGGSFPAVRNNAQWRQAVGIAHVAMNKLWDGPADDALFFHAKRVSPNWGKHVVASVGNHIFYR